MDSFLGQIKLFAFQFAPDHWMDCAGQVIHLNEGTSELFAVIGNRYGGDGEFTFGLPNLRGAEPLPGLRYCICVKGAFPRPN